MENGTTTTAADANNTAVELAEILKRVARFVSRERAFSFAGHGKRWVMLGDDQQYWVARPVDCGRLEQMGYEYAD